LKNVVFTTTLSPRLCYLTFVFIEIQLIVFETKIFFISLKNEIKKIEV
jgi:hypothetical protein